MVVCNMSKKKAKKKSKLTAPVVAGLVLLGAVSGMGGEDTTNNAPSTEPEQPAIVETVSKAEKAEVITDSNSGKTVEIVEDQPVQEPEPVSQEPIQQEPAPQEPAKTETKTDSQPDNAENSVKVYITKSGKRYHYDSNCNGANYFESTLKDATNKGLTPCEKCVLK
jgi:hypothetical protein